VISSPTEWDARSSSRSTASTSLRCVQADKSGQSHGRRAAATPSITGRCTRTLAQASHDGGNALHDVKEGSLLPPTPRFLGQRGRSIDAAVANLPEPQPAAYHPIGVNARGQAGKVDVAASAGRKLDSAPSRRRP
jgi:hypothetical protein